MRFFKCSYENRTSVEIFPEMFEVMGITPEQYFQGCYYYPFNRINCNSEKVKNFYELENGIVDLSAQLERLILDCDNYMFYLDPLIKIALLLDTRKALKGVKRPDKFSKQYELVRFDKVLVPYDSNNNFYLKLFNYEFYYEDPLSNKILTYINKIFFEKNKNSGKEKICTEKMSSFFIDFTHEMKKHEFLFNESLNITEEEIRLKIKNGAIEEDKKEECYLTALNYILKEQEKGNI